MSSTTPAAAFAANSPVPLTADDLDLTGGALDVLANFWLTRISFADRNDTRSPSLNLDEQAAQPAFQCLINRGVQLEEAGLRGAGFRLGLAIAEAIRKAPFDCETAIRAILDEEVESIREAMIEPDGDLDTEERRLLDTFHSLGDRQAERRFVRALCGELNSRGLSDEQIAAQLSERGDPLDANQLREILADST